MKSGTSIGADIHEIKDNKSKTDFIHKLNTVAKKLEETKYWITIYERASSYKIQKD